MKDWSKEKRFFGGLSCVEQVFFDALLSSVANTLHYGTPHSFYCLEIKHDKQ